MTMNPPRKPTRVESARRTLTQPRMFRVMDILLIALGGVVGFLIGLQ